MTLESLKLDLVKPKISWHNEQNAIEEVFETLKMPKDDGD